MSGGHIFGGCESLCVYMSLLISDAENLFANLINYGDLLRDFARCVDVIYYICGLAHGVKQKHMFESKAISAFLYVWMILFYILEKWWEEDENNWINDEYWIFTNICKIIIFLFY